MRGRHEKPAGLARICGWGLCILLVFAILGTVLSALMAQMMSDQALHKRIAMDERVQAEEMSHIRTKAEEIAEANHFDASLIYDRITTETLLELHRRGVDWWMNLAQTGKAAELPEWDGSDLWDALLTDEAFLASHDQTLVRKNANDIVFEMTETLSRQVFPLRTELLSEGFEVLGRRVDVAGILQAFLKAPWIFILTVLILIGLVFLLFQRKFGWAVRLIGSAAGAAGLVLLFCIVLLRLMNLSAMAHESSVRLGIQVAALEQTATWELAGICLLLALAASLCFRKSGRIKSSRSR